LGVLIQVNGRLYLLRMCGVHSGRRGKRMSTFTVGQARAKWCAISTLTHGDQVNSELAAFLSGVVAPAAAALA
jgi:hypothetical protein